jgi:hypothetical protein
MLPLFERDGRDARMRSDATQPLAEKLGRFPLALEHRPAFSTEGHC